MVYDKVVEIIKNQFDIDEVSPETNLMEDLRSDSIGLLELVMEIEEEFNLEIDDSQLGNIKTVQDVVDSIEEAIK
ncbi:MAG: acyl carrier protein [Tissierellia bacterium]|nr:acyl carrier protein [Tissierellia bacterium]